MSAAPIRVIVRSERRKDPAPSVVIATRWSDAAPLTVWDPDCGHGGASLAWYRRTRPATRREAAPLLAKLRRQYAPEFKLVVGKRLNLKKL
jgi:hypothetical protein